MWFQSCPAASAQRSVSHRRFLADGDGILLLCVKFIRVFFLRAEIGRALIQLEPEGFILDWTGQWPSNFYAYYLWKSDHNILKFAKIKLIGTYTLSFFVTEGACGALGGFHNRHKSP